MSDDSTRAEFPAGGGAKVRLIGRVERQRLAAGTKSDHMGDRKSVV